MKIAIIQFPGSNCESEAIYAVRQAQMEVEEFLWNRNPNDLKNFDGFFIVGGFSYEDRSRSGIIASLDPIMNYLKAENEKGKPILGICNGAQILVESGIVPGLQNNQVAMALAVNKRVKDGRVLGTGFYNTWACVQSSAPTGRCAFSKHFQPGEFMKIPVAHGEGRFVMENSLLEELKKNNQTVFRYCDEAGNISKEFPVNPNGAMYNLAAVCNPAGNAMAMMPHPERTAAGQPIFTSMREFIQENKTLNCHPERSEGSLSYHTTESSITDFTPDTNSTEWLIDLIITDNEAVTVQNALKHLGIDADIKRRAHWEISFEENSTKDSILDSIKNSGELFNSNKEKIVDTNKLNNTTESAFILVRYRDDFAGQSKLQTLRDRFDIKGLETIKKGVLWQITPKSNFEETIKKILDSRILFNQYSQVGYNYTLTK